MAFYKIFTDKDPNIDRHSLFDSIKSSIGLFDNCAPSGNSK